MRYFFVSTKLGQQYKSLYIIRGGTDHWLVTDHWDPCAKWSVLVPGFKGIGDSFRVTSIVWPSWRLLTIFPPLNFNSVWSLYSILLCNLCQTWVEIFLGTKLFWAAHFWGVGVYLFLNFFFLGAITPIPTLASSLGVKLQVFFVRGRIMSRSP